jgi:predicted pyridoxine 5'-phosphate oxidase superfamily flavin-nucleotide-binding protein
MAHVDIEFVRRVLIDAPGDALCDACLAAIGEASAEAIHTETVALLASASDEFERASFCASCHRHVAAILYRATCAHCSRRLQGVETGFRMGEEIFHVACLRRLITDDTIGLPRALGRRSRRLIEQSRRRMREGQRGWPPLESA